MEILKNILIINTSPIAHCYLDNLLDGLNSRGYSFYLLSTVKEKKWSAKKIYFGPDIAHWGGFLIFMLLTPINLLRNLTRLIYYKYKKNIQSIICLDIKEKITISPLAKILKIKTIWIENFNKEKPKNIYEKIIFFWYKIFSAWATIIVFSEKDRFLLEKAGVKKENINTINHALKNGQKQFQDNIFNQITGAGKTEAKNKFFTIGIITPLVKNQKIETILKSIKIALSASLQMQLIIIGDGEERKNLIWMAKKMEIDNMVWFVGEQNHIIKWINNFDVFIISNEKPDLSDMENALIAMGASLPIIGPENEGLEDIIPEAGKEFLIDMSDSEELAQKIIKIQQKEQLRKQLGRINRENIKNNLTIDSQIEKIIKII